MTNDVNFGDVMVTVDAGPNFEPYSQPFKVNEESERFEIVLVPASDAVVTINVSSSDPAITNTLPSDASWAIMVGDDELERDTFAAEHLDLPATIDVNGRVPFGTYDVTVNAGPNFESYTGTITVDRQIQTIDIVLDPAEDATVTVEVVSANPAIASVLPDDATWTILVDDTELDSDTFAAEHLQLPATIPVNERMPFGMYTIVVEAGPTFERYEESFTVDSQIERFTVELIPVDEAALTVRVSSASPAIAGQLPEGSTWTVTGIDDPEFTFTDEFLPEHLDISEGVDIPVEAPVPFGRYTITVDAGPTFEPYEAQVEINQVSQLIEVTLIPVDEAMVTISTASADPEIANILPEDATWTLLSGDTELASDIFAGEHLQLPIEITVENPVPFGTYEVIIDATPDFEWYMATITLDEPSERIEIVLVPIEPEAPTAQVTLAVSSADDSVGDTLPEGSTWTVTSVENPALTMSGVFAADSLSLPLTIVMPSPLPYGDYLVEIDATPAFELYSGTFTVGPMEMASIQLFGLIQQVPEIVTFDILLQPVQQPTPTPTVPVTPEPTIPATPEPTDPAATVSPTATAATPDTEVIKLPSTGNGTSENTTGVLLMVAAAGAMVAAAGAVAIRSKRA